MSNKFILQACESINRKLDDGVALKYISYDNEELPHRVCFFVNGVQSIDIILSVEQFKSIDFMVELGGEVKRQIKRDMENAGSFKDSCCDNIVLNVGPESFFYKFDRK